MSVIDEAKEKLINIMPITYQVYIKNTLAGDFAVDLLKEIEKRDKVNRGH